MFSLSFPLSHLHSVCESECEKKKKNHTERKGEWEIARVCVGKGKKDEKKRTQRDAERKEKMDAAFSPILPYFSA